MHVRVAACCDYEGIDIANGNCKVVPVPKYVMKMYPLLKHHAMKTYWRSGGIAPRILNLSTSWR